MDLGSTMNIQTHRLARENVDRSTMRNSNNLINPDWTIIAQSKISC